MIILFFLASNSVIFYRQLGFSTSSIVFFIFCLFFFIKNRDSYSVILTYPIVIIILVGINILLLNTETLGNNGWSIILNAFSSFLFFRSFNFYRFRYLYIKVLAFITLFGILDFVLYQAGFLDSYTITPKFGGEMKMSFIYPVERFLDESPRYFGLWHEPGAGMIFQIIGILMYIEDFINHTLKKNEKAFLIILVTGALFSQSTTAYLALMSIGVFYFLRNRSLFSIKGLIILALGSLFIYEIYNSDVIVQKFSDQGSNVTSKEIRYADNFISLQMALDRPFTGYGFNTSEFNTIKDITKTSSNNGVLYMCACLGIYYILILIFFSIQSLNKWLKNKLNILFVLIVFIMIESNEVYLEFPISYVFLSIFGSYSSLEYQLRRQSS